MNYAKKEGRKSWIVSAAAVVLAIIFFTISIYSTNSINTNLKVLSEHPFAVSTAVFKLKTAVSANHIRMSRLTMYNKPEDVEVVQTALNELNAKNQEQIDYILHYYLGPASEAQHLSDLMDELYRIEEAHFHTAATLTLEENVTFIREEIEPIHNEIDATTDTMLAFINNTVKRLSRESNGIQTMTSACSLAMSLALVLFATLYQRSVSKKIKEISYRDFLFNTLSENVDTVFMIYSLEKRQMEYVTYNSERILGISSNMLETEKINIFDYCEKDDCEQLQQVLQSEMLRTNIQKECMVQNPVLNQKNCIKISISPVFKNDKVNRYILSLSDQAEVKRNQEILRDALANAQNSNAAKSEFLARMSHEIRTPMNAIIGMSTIATTASNNPEKIENCLSKILISSKHLLHLINDVLDMSKIESGKFSMSNEHFVLTEVIENVSSIVYGQATAKNQRYDVVGDVPHGNLIGDQLRLNQILLNLLTNAVKYTPEGGKIKLSIQEVQYKIKNMVRLRFTISDNGIGMSEDFMKKLFTPFEQETQSTGGTGLGLAITKNLVTLAGGAVYVESKQGEGTCFHVEIPFGISGVVSAPNDKDFGDLKILVADDDQDTCEHTTIILERLGIYAEWVLSGLEAVERTLKAYEENVCYDVIFMDWKMPGVDGIEATRRIRKTVGPETLIIIISSFNWPEIEQEAKIAGATAFISKPMFQSTIYNTLTRVVKMGSEPAPSAALPAADFTGKRFLIAEDNAFNMEIAKELLEMTGAVVDESYNGKEALERFAHSQPGFYDGILMDIQMPVMDGHAAARAIRELPHVDAKNIVIIAMTANAFSEDVAAALHAGMNAHVAKPIDLEVLYKVLSGTVLEPNTAT